MTETLRDFANRHRLRLRRNPDDDSEFVLGRFGHLYQHDEAELGLLFAPEPPRPHLWAYARHRLLDAGFKLRQNGDWEGTATFAPDNEAHLLLAMKILGVRRKRTLSPAQLEAAKRNLTAAKTRSIGPAEGGV